MFYTVYSRLSAGAIFSILSFGSTLLYTKKQSLLQIIARVTNEQP